MGEAMARLSRPVSCPCGTITAPRLSTGKEPDLANSRLADSIPSTSFQPVRQTKLSSSRPSAFGHPTSHNGLALRHPRSNGKRVVIRMFTGGVHRHSEVENGAALRVQDLGGRFAGGAAIAMSPMEGAFVMEAEVGLVECGPRGCRPVYDTRAHGSNHGDWLPEATDMNAVESEESHLEDQNCERRLGWQGRDVGVGAAFEVEFAMFLDEVWLEKESAEKYYETALRRNPHDPRLLASYAQFAWKRMGNFARAERLYKKALAEAPDSSEVLAGYALFLWQSEPES